MTSGGKGKGLTNYSNFEEKCWSHVSVTFRGTLRRAKSRDSLSTYRRIASESYCCDSNRQRSLELISPPKTQDLVSIRSTWNCRMACESWPAFAGHWRLAIGDLAHQRWDHLPSSKMSLLGPPRPGQLHAITPYQWR